MKKGLIMINTGNGKGKTTAALGMAMRAAGQGMKTCFIQFIKGSWKYGEIEAIKKFAGTIDFHVMGKGFTWKSENMEEDRTAARTAWELAQKAIASKEYQLVILDELTYLLTYNMIGLDSVLNALAQKPSDLHVLITGRNAPQKLIEVADLVTEMQVVKHPLKNGIRAQKGIEF
jgi:cob(I)alamin adenosyltransferase